MDDLTAFVRVTNRVLALLTLVIGAMLALTLWWKAGADLPSLSNARRHLWLVAIAMGLPFALEAYHRDLVRVASLAVPGLSRLSADAARKVELALVAFVIPCALAACSFRVRAALLIDESEVVHPAVPVSVRWLVAIAALAFAELALTATVLVVQRRTED